MRFFFLIHTKARILNKKALFYHFFHKKIWNFQGEDLSLQRVFHSIRFKVNKVGIQWYPIFFALHPDLTENHPLFFSPRRFVLPLAPAVCRGVAPVCATTQEIGLFLPIDTMGRHTKRAFPHRTARMVSRNGDHRDRSMGKCPELIRHCPWFSYACRHRRRPKARSGGHISCICADSARGCHRWPPRRAGNCSKGRE